MKKLFVLGALLAALLLLAACGGNNDGNGGGAVPGNGQAQAPAEPDEPEEVFPDLGGFVFTYATLHPTWFRPEEDLGAPVNAARVRILEEIEANYNVTIEIMNLPPDMVLDLLQPAVFAGDKFADVVEATHWAFGPAMGAGLFLDLQEIPTLDLGSPWWSQQISDVFTVDGRVLATAGSFTHPTFPTYNMHFNRRIWDEMGFECPYELVRNGQWTWDRFSYFATRAMLDMDGDGVVSSANDRFGIVAPQGDFIRAQFFSMGGRIFATNPATGRVEMAANNPEALRRIEWMQNFHRTPGMMAETGPLPWEEIRQVFFDGRALFLSSQVDTDLREMIDDFGMLPMPKWDEAQPAHIGLIDHNGKIFGVPITNRDLRETGYILEAMGRAFMEVYTLRLEDMADTMYRDDDSEDMLLNFIRGTTTSDMALFVGFDSVLGAPGALILSAMSPYGEADVAATMTAIQEIVEFRLAEFFGYD